jgi:hypothetical protein
MVADDERKVGQLLAKMPKLKGRPEKASTRDNAFRSRLSHRQ